MDNKLWNTGLSETGNLVPTGQKDQNWTVWTPGIQLPPVKPTEEPQPGDPAFVLSNQRNDKTDPYFLTPYFLTTDSQWIWANADGAVDPNDPNGDYVFQCPFHIKTDRKLNWVEIGGDLGRR